MVADDMEKVVIEGAHTCIVVDVSAELLFAVGRISGYFRESLDNGVEFKDGEVVQIGWGVAKLVLGEDKCLHLWEPDFKGMPISWVIGVDRLLRQLFVQQEICNQLGCETDFPSLMQSTLYERLEMNLGELLLERGKSEGRFSGWIVRSSTNYSGYKSLYELALEYPFLVGYLALPPGAVVNVSAQDVSVKYGDRVEAVTSNPFLRQLHSNGVDRLLQQNA